MTGSEPTTVSDPTGMLFTFPADAVPNEAGLALDPVHPHSAAVASVARKCRRVVTSAVVRSFVIYEFSFVEVSPGDCESVELSVAGPWRRAVYADLPGAPG